MKKIIAMLFYINLVWGMLVPTPFIQEPEPIQRVGYKYTKKYFNRKLFNFPYGVAMTKLRNTEPLQELIVVSDLEWHRILYTVVKESTGEAEWIKAFGKYGHGPSELFYPAGISIDTAVYNGNKEEYTLYVADARNFRIQILKYMVRKEEMKRIGSLNYDFFLPLDVASVTKDNGDGSYIVVVDQNAHRITLIESNSQGSYNFLMHYGTRGIGPDKFLQPSGVEITKAEGYGPGYFIYVADRGNNRVVALKFIPEENKIYFVKDYRVPGGKLTSVTASQYYCVYAVESFSNKIYVFTPGLGELLYVYGGSQLLNRPIKVYIDRDRLGLTEKWTENTGLQYFRIIPEIRELKAEPDSFDVTEQDSIKISFRVDETAAYLTMVIQGNNQSRTIFENVYYSPGKHFVYWDGKDDSGNLFLPGNYTIYVSSSNYTHHLVTAQLKVKGTRVNVYNISGKWKKENEPYVILKSDISIGSGDSLIIEPGVKIMFLKNYQTKIWVHGKLKAIGTFEDSIFFLPYKKLWEITPQDTGYWKGINFFTNKPFILKYFKIGYGGYAYGSLSPMIYMPGLQTNFEISNGRIIFSKGEGLRVSTSKEAIVENVIFENNMNYGINVIFSPLVILKNLSFFKHKNSYVMRITTRLPILENITADSSNRKRGILFDNVEITRGYPRVLGDKVPYVIKAASTFYVHDTLKVLKGVIFKFDSLASLNISHAPFIVEGTETDTVYFTSLKDDKIGGDTNGDSTNTLPSPGDWKGIYFSPDTIQSIMNYFKIKYGGGGYGGANIYNSLAPLVLKNGSVEKSLNYGIVLDLYGYYSPPRSVLIKNISFDGNISYGIYAVTMNHNLKIRNVNFKKHKNTYLMKLRYELPDIDSVFADTTNKKIGIEIDNGLVTSGRPKTLKCKIPFVVNNSLYNYDTLKIFPGVIMKFDSAAYFSVRSPLIAEGTISDSIYFTSLKDDEIGGDTNGDSTSTFPSPGDWKGIEFSGSGKSILKFFKIRYGKTNIHNVWGADSIKFLYGTVEKAKEYGYAFSDYGEIYFNKIRENKIGIGTPYALYDKPKVNFSEIYNNTEYGIKNTYPSYTIDAEYNFWGDSTGPYHPNLNPSGQGNPVSNYVDFIPWLKFPPKYFYGKITKDTVWENIILLIGDVLIDSFATLQIRPGTKIFVLDKDLENIGNDLERIEIIVFGKILSIGTTSDIIIFDQLNDQEGKWVGIIIKNEGSFLAYTEIKKASIGISIQNTKDVLIKNSEIRKNTLGLEIINSQNITLKSSNISENLTGINILNSKCAIESSLIYKNYGKIKNIMFSKEDTFYTDTLTGIYILNGDLILKNNRIVENFTGLYTTGSLNLYSYGNYVKDNMWHGYDIAVSKSSNLIFENDTFINNGWYPKEYNLHKKYYIEFAGLSLAHRYYSGISNIEVKNSYFKNNCDGIRIGRYGNAPFPFEYNIKIKGNEFDSNFYAITFHGGRVSHINSILTKNILKNSDSANIIIAAPFDSAKINIGNLENNDTIDDGENHILGSIYSIIDSSYYDIYAQGNLWDYSDSSLIDRKIYDDDENPNLSKVNFKYFYKAGKIIKDTVLTGEIRIGGDLIIPENVKLTIKEPATIKFAKNFDILKSGNDINKSELIIYGRLKIESENEKIIFTSDGFIKEKGDFYGIIFKKDKKEISGTSENLLFDDQIKNIKIEYSYKGIEFLRENEKLKLMNSEIENSNYGIYFDGKNLEIQNSKITLSDTGIYVLNGKGFIKETEIKDNEIGILNKGNSEINFDKSYIMNNKIGIYVDENSRPRLKNGKNFICFNNLYNLYNNTIYDIEAQRNWWGTENEDSISLLIYDFYDDSAKGKVYFKPIWVPKENISGIQGYEEIKEEFIRLKNTIFRNSAEIEIISFKDSKISLKIYDVCGRKIKEIEENIKKGKNKFKISGLKKGVYFIEVKFNEKLKRFKIIKI